MTAIPCLARFFSIYAFFCGNKVATRERIELKKFSLVGNLISQVESKVSLSVLTLSLQRKRSLSDHRVLRVWLLCVQCI